MRLDDEIILGDVEYGENWDAVGCIARISWMASQLKRYEVFISRLGIADVTITRLPNATRINIDYNDVGIDPIEFFIANGMLSMLERQLDPLLHKYLDPYLEN